MSDPTRTPAIALRCRADVFKRDTYRVSREGGGCNFRMHYNRCRCSRVATTPAQLCTQHARAGYVTTSVELGK